MTVQAFWAQFLRDTGRDADTPCPEAFHFELTERWANELLRLVLAGQKRATSSSLTCYELEGERIPAPGDWSIVTDWAGEPHCVIETTRVDILPFREMTFGLCSLEGKDDSLDSWRRSHIAFFTAEGKEAGYAFTEDMPVIFEQFRVIYARESPAA